MNDQVAADDLTVAVTGATGFIGARVVEMLSAGELPMRPRVLSRRRAGAGAERGIDLRDQRSVRAALAGCRALVHCAFDFADMDANLDIARVLARECVASGARLIHVSTAAVYEPFPDGMLDESVSVDRPGSHYKQVKLAIERELLRQVREGGLEAVILQPTVVYGPHGRAWTDSPIRELLTGTVVLPDAGDGMCNAVYVDDVCRAIVAAIDAPVASGERILVSGPQPVAWREFYGAYQEILGVDALQLLPREAGAPLAGREAPSFGTMRRRMTPRLSALRVGLKAAATRLLGARALSRVKLAVNYTRGFVGHRRHVATGAKLALFQASCHVRTDKARRLLGYEPEFDLPRGMRSTQRYVEATYGRLARYKRRR